MSVMLCLGLVACLEAESAQALTTDLRARLSRELVALDEPCSFVMEQRRVSRLFESQEELTSDPLAAVYSGSSNRESVLAPGHLAVWAKLADAVLADSALATGWERKVESYTLVHSPGASLQSSLRGGKPHHDLLTDTLSISSSWQSGQVDVYEGQPKIIRYGPSYLLAPLNVGAAPAKWFVAQEWNQRLEEGDHWLQVEFPTAGSAFELIRFGKSSERVLQVVVFYAPGDVVATFLEYPEVHDRATRLPSRSLRISCSGLYVEMLELTITGWSEAPSDESFKIPIPRHGTLVDHRHGKSAVASYDLDRASWPAELLPYVVSSPAKPSSPIPAGR